jgi:hypothetical protein
VSSPIEAWFTEHGGAATGGTVAAGFDNDTAIGAGRRNAHLTSLAGSMRRRGMSAEALAAALLAENVTRCRPPLPECEVSAIAASVARYSPAETNASAANSYPTPEPLSALLEQHQADVVDEWFVAHLIPQAGITMFHGQPRDWKSLIALSVGLSVAIGKPCLHNERFGVSRPRVVAYVTEEDAGRRVADRARLFMAGMGISTIENFHVSACKGLDLDDSGTQDALIAWALSVGCEVMILDPVRSLTACADQGPRELKPFATFLRRFMRETGAAIWLVHHDTKPIVGQHDSRRRPHRASGGGVFSIADNPINVDHVDGDTRLLVPTAFKFCEAPEPVTVTLQCGGGWMRLVGTTGAATTPDRLELHTRIVEALKARPSRSGADLQKHLRVRRDALFAALDQLAAAGTVVMTQRGRAKLWSYRPMVPERCGTMERSIDSHRSIVPTPIGGTITGTIRRGMV